MSNKCVRVPEYDRRFAYGDFEESDCYLNSKKELIWVAVGFDPNEYHPVTNHVSDNEAEVLS
jgi:hypothetical protein